MSSLSSLIRNENMKIYRRPRTWAMIGVFLVALLMLTGILELDQNPNIRPDNWQQHLMESNQRLQQQISQPDTDPEMKLRLEKVLILNQYYLEHHMNPYEITLWSVVNVSANLLVLITLLTVIVSAGMLAAEYSWGTIKLLLVGPASRTKILFSKYISTILFACALLVLNFTISFALGACWRDSGT
ncbi:ABC transporter permease [Paenibacillus melissococcoides]|uniref:ABC transporter permease n=1 Tax=Paenibacillus melissococcoides TaxID=2912268 RepID=A0ABN8TZG6_9BACL|nr:MULTISPECIES: ABC transporter permease [Paenibacillus]MEB9893351.1 ABC transporter permease [Bacillus cereus]CAH8244107.1 ABC transporter permease [Paenibacillus melissococcoides]CAH8703851.1 ABC transporter permease [Paenibacillus melissococcoides]CAH8706434.1 ABC transporter permease [Paenibacillus melissococcoides]GIO79736.1 hypothetical protein J6TS7_33460 [Paenibacillus dendritiformis]